MRTDGEQQEIGTQVTPAAVPASGSVPVLAGPYTPFQSQRDCFCQPRVVHPPQSHRSRLHSMGRCYGGRARNELPWVGPVRSINPEGVEAPPLKHCQRSEQILAATPLGLIRVGTFSQGSSFLATLIGVPKLFIGGEESFPLSPQPTVNNFARRSNRFCEQDCRRAEWPAVTPRWMTNAQPVSLDESAQSFAPARRLGPRRILRCRQQNVSAIRPSLGPSQRARNSKSRQP